MKDEFEKARDEEFEAIGRRYEGAYDMFCIASSWAYEYLTSFHSETKLEKAFVKLQAENKKLKKILAKEFNENDEFGAEYLGITMVREENKKLREALETIIMIDSGFENIARQALEKEK